MSFRASLKNLIRRDAEHPSLRERAAELRGDLAGQTRRAIVAGSVAAAVPLPTLAAPAPDPSDLARACDAAVAHLAWINGATARGEEHWPDDRLHRELDTADGVLWRVADEPARNLNDIAAKARLIHASDGEMLGLSDLAGDRATATLLREVIALAPGRSLPPQQMPAAPVERAEYRARLLASYAEDRASRPVTSRLPGWTVRHEAAMLVQRRCWAIAREVVDLPPPKTADGLALAALASAILVEADFTSNDPTVTAAVGLTRAVLAFTGEPLPPGFAGFGDEPDHRERDQALHNGPEGHLPAWAMAQAQAEMNDDA